MPRQKRLYNDRKWREAKDRFLRSQPLCQTCDLLGKTTPADVVDHVTPHKGDQALFWDQGNWQSLCEHHHNTKTWREGRGYVIDWDQNPDEVVVGSNATLIKSYAEARHRNATWIVDTKSQDELMRESLDRMMVGVDT